MLFLILILNINICIKGIHMWLQEMFKIFIDILFNIFSSKGMLDEEKATTQMICITFTYSVALQNNLGWSFSISANLEIIMCPHYTRIKREKSSTIKPNDGQLKEKMAIRRQDQIRKVLDIVQANNGNSFEKIEFSERG